MNIEEKIELIQEGTLEIIDVDENTKDDVSEDEEYSKVEIIEVIDDAEEVEYVDDSERNYKEWGDDEDFSTSDDDKFSSEEVSTLPSFRFTKDNTASIGDLNFEFSRPDFGSLDSDEGEEVEEGEEKVTYFNPETEIKLTDAKKLDKTLDLWDR